MSYHKGFIETDVPEQSGKCFIVTGANAGIGFETARVLAARGARVLLGCRAKERAEEAITRIKRLTPNANLAWLPLDLGDIEAVRAAAGTVSDEPRIDALINNAGIMNPPLMRTKQGFESQFGINHLGVFALTSLLLPKLAETRGSRVVVTSSIAHLKAKIDWDDLNAERSYSKENAMAPASWPMHCSSSNWTVACGQIIRPSRPLGFIPVLQALAWDGTWARSSWQGRLSACSSIVPTKAHGRRYWLRRVTSSRVAITGRLVSGDQRRRWRGETRTAGGRRGTCQAALGRFHRHDRGRPRIARNLIAPPSQ